MDSGTFILPDYVIPNCQVSRLTKTTLEPNFHVSNSKNKDFPYNGTFILPDHVILMFQIVNLGKKMTHLFLPAG